MYKVTKSVSVIMSVYNEENTVNKVLSKLKNLDYIDEIIVVDNGSTDNSRALIKNSMKVLKFIDKFVLFHLKEMH